MSRVTSLSRRAQAKVCVTSYWLRRVTDNGGAEYGLVQGVAAGGGACDARLPCRRACVRERHTDAPDEVAVLTVSAYWWSLDGRISTLPSRRWLSSSASASSREHSTNHLHRAARSTYMYVHAHRPTDSTARRASLAAALQYSDSAVSCIKQNILDTHIQHGSLHCRVGPSFSANPPYRTLSFFSFRFHYMDFSDCLLLLLSTSVYLLFSFPVFTLF